MEPEASDEQTQTATGGLFSFIKEKIKSAASLEAITGALTKLLNYLKRAMHSLLPPPFIQRMTPEELRRCQILVEWLQARNRDQNVPFPALPLGHRDELRPWLRPWTRQARL